MKAVVIVALGMVAGLTLGYLVHPLGEQKTTQAAFFDSEKTLVTASGDIPLPGCDVIFANSSTGAESILISGKNNVFGGCVQSNSGIKIQGTGNQVNRTVRFVTTFDNSGGALLLNGSLQVPHEYYPWPYQTIDYSPTGCRAAAAGAGFTNHAGDWSTNAPTTGLHYVTGNANIDARGFTGKLTIVATGTISIKTDAAGIRPYIDNLTALSASTSNTALEHDGGGGRESGAFFAPEGALTWKAKDALLSGVLMAKTIQVSGQGNTFTARAPTAHATC